MKLALASTTRENRIREARQVFIKQSACPTSHDDRRLPNGRSDTNAGASKIDRLRCRQRRLRAWTTCGRPRNWKETLCLTMTKEEEMEEDETWRRCWTKGAEAETMEIGSPRFGSNRVRSIDWTAAAISKNNNLPVHGDLSNVRAASYAFFSLYSPYARRSFALRDHAS